MRLGTRRLRSSTYVESLHREFSRFGVVTVGGCTLKSPVMTASGTAGHADELASFFNLNILGATVVKSLSSFAWLGNPAPRLHMTPSGMINAVGLQGPGVQSWLDNDLPRLMACGVPIVASIWGRSVEEYEQAALMLKDAPTNVIAVEVNLSCPNLEGRRGIFAHDPDLSAAVVVASRHVNRPIWAKLSPNTDRVVEVAAAVHQSGASAVTLINTALGMAIDVSSAKPILGNGGGGLSGPAVHPIAVRTVFDVHAALPTLDIIGVGGVRNAHDAIELMMAGAKAVQVGTATFADPYASASISVELAKWARDHSRRNLEFTSWSQITGSAHRK